MNRFLSDRFRQTRGGRSQLLELSCDGCGAYVAHYQKDGPGELKRLYLDRVLQPSIKTAKGDFACRKCKRILGTFYTYQKERRPAVRLYQGSIVKRRTTLSELS